MSFTLIGKHEKDKMCIRDRAYPLGGVHHIPHGQANQLMFADVMRKYQEKKPIGKLNQLEELLGAERDTEPVFALETLYKLMDEVLEKDPLHEHGVTCLLYTSRCV